jgi:tetratricopeptide (TPR) repeat protein
MSGVSCWSQPRAVEAQRHRPLSDALSELRREELLTRIAVGPLGSGETSALIGATLGAGEGVAGGASTVSTELAQGIYARSDGNAFFIRQLTHALQEQDELHFTGGQWRLSASSVSGASASAFDAPEGIRAVIGQRLARLTPLTQDMLREASVLGQLFVFGELQRMGGRGEQEVEEALEEAVSAGIVREGERDRYHFDHALTRDTLYADLPARRKRRLHRAAADTLERVPDHERRAAELSYHLLVADEGERALPYALLAGDQAEGVYAHAEAERHYRRALELARELREQARQAEALEKLGQARASLSRHADSLEARERAARAYEALGDAEGELRVLAALAWTQQGDTIERAEAVLARILPRLGALDAEVARSGRASPGLGWASLNVATLYLTANRLHDAVALIERGVALAREAEDEALLARAYMSLGYVGMVTGSKGSLTDFLHAVALAERADSDDLFLMINFVTSTYLEEGQLALAKQSAERALALVERRQAPAQIAFMLDCLAEPAFYRGDWDEARERFAQAAAIEEQLDPTLPSKDSHGTSVTLCLLDLAQERGADESARRLEALLTLLRGRANHPALQTGALGEVALAERNLLANHAAAAQARLTAFLTVPGMAEHIRMFAAKALALPALAWAEAELGHDTAAAERLEQAITIATARRWRPWLVDALRVKGLLAARQRRWEDARAALDEAITMSRDMPYPYAEAKALYVYGQLHVAKSEPQQARKKYEQALTICDWLGERLYRNYIEQALAGIRS